MNVISKILLLIIPLSLTAQSDIQDKIVKLICAGDEVSIRSYLGESVEIVTPEENGVYSQNQAVQILKVFFDKYPCGGFEISHTGNSAGGSKFVVGTYQTGSSKLRVSIFLKQVDQKFIIQELSFEE